MLRRICVIGAPGTGKTTLAHQLGNLLAVHTIEMDALHWGPDWTPQPEELMNSALAEQLTAEGWVVDGTYRRYWPLIWPQADTLVWLDYGLGRNLWQLWWRTTRRIWTREILWNNNRENWREAFWGKDNLFLYAWRSRPRLKRQIPAALQEPAFAHLKLVHLRSPQETRRWLASLRSAAQAQS